MKLYRTGKFLLVVVMISIMLARDAAPQVGPGLRHVPGTDGVTVFGPASGQYFRMSITGRDAGRLRTKKKYWYRADGVNFEFFSEETWRFLMTDLPRRPDDRVVLALYRSDFARRNPDLKLRSSWVKLASGETALFWIYDKSIASPDTPNATEREMFLVFAARSLIFGLFAPVPSGSTEREIRRILIRTLGTLTFSDDPFVTI